MKYSIILVLFLAGCGFGKPSVTDPCAKAPTVCWGPAGIQPGDVPVCQQLIACHDWQMGTK